jgi:hypothetical protein
MLCAVAPDQASTSGQHRYGIVLALTVIAVIEIIIAPATPISRAVALLIQGTILLAVIATSRGERVLRRVAGILVASVLAGLALAVGLSAVPGWVASVPAGIAVVVVLVVLVRGVTRLIREQGVTPRAVAGALAIYLLVGLTFALVIDIVARIGPTFFAQGREGTLSEQVYFSFTTMTTTGYGDLTPATSLGHALAVLEMLVGQIYLVTVIGLLVGNMTRRTGRPAGEPPDTHAAGAGST